MPDSSEEVPRFCSKMLLNTYSGVITKLMYIYVGGGTQILLILRVRAPRFCQPMKGVGTQISLAKIEKSPPHTPTLTPNPQ